MQLILAMVTAFFLYRDGVAVRRSLIMAGQRIAGDNAPRLLRVAYATIVGVVYGVLGTALAQALLLMIGSLGHRHPRGPAARPAPVRAVPDPVRAAAHRGAGRDLALLGGEVGWAAFIVVWSIAAGILTDNVLKPWLISRGSDLPLILILFGVIGGAVTFGGLGLFLGPTLLAVGYELIREWNGEAPERS